jgi:hypothetical protein
VIPVTRGGGLHLRCAVPMLGRCGGQAERAGLNDVNREAGHQEKGDGRGDPDEPMGARERCRRLLASSECERRRHGPLGGFLRLTGQKPSHGEVPGANEDDVAVESSKRRGGDLTRSNHALEGFPALTAEESCLRQRDPGGEKLRLADTSPAAGRARVLTKTHGSLLSDRSLVLNRQIGYLALSQKLPQIDFP